MSASSSSINQICDIIVEYLVQERYDYISIAAKLRLVTGSVGLRVTCHQIATELEERAPDR